MLTALSIYKPNDATYLLAQRPAAPMVDHINKGVYAVDHCRITQQITLTRLRSQFEIPERVYGDEIQENADLIWSTYLRRKDADCVGSILHGAPGTGKSLTAEMLCNKAIQFDMPVFVITQRLPVEVLYALVGSSGRCVLHFDEFATACYSGRIDPELLTFFSDSSLKGHLFILTDNDLQQYPHAFINRPGRFLFRIQYKPIQPDALLALLPSLGIREDLHQELLQYHLSTPYTYDILLRIAEELKYHTTSKAQMALLRTMNIPRPVKGELIVYFEHQLNGYTQRPRKMTATKKSDTEVEVIIQGDEGEGKEHIVSLSILNPQIVPLLDETLWLKVAMSDTATAADVGKELTLQSKPIRSEQTNGQYQQHGNSIYSPAPYSRPNW